MKARGILALCLAGTLGIVAGVLFPRREVHAFREPPPPTLDEMAEVYGLAEQYATAGEPEMLAELKAFVTAYNETSIPIFSREFAEGRCEILPSHHRTSSSLPSYMEIKSTEHSNGIERVAYLNPAEYPMLLEYRIRIEWLAKECRKRRYDISKVFPHTD